MRGVMLEVPTGFLIERARTDRDQHMVPPPGAEQQRIGIRLVDVLLGLAKEADLELRHETGLFDPEVEEPTSYHQPDLALFDAAVSTVI